MYVCFDQEKSQLSVYSCSSAGLYPWTAEVTTFKSRTSRALNSTISPTALRSGVVMDHDRDRYQVSVYLFRLQFRSAPSRDPYFPNGDRGARSAAKETSSCVQIGTDGVIGAFQLQLGPGLFNTVHINSNIAKQTLQSHELHTKMISDIVLNDVKKAQYHQQ